MRIFPTACRAWLRVGASRQAKKRPHRADSTERAHERAMSIFMRTQILGAAIGGIAAAMTTIAPTQAGIIGPGTLPVTEPALLAVPIVLGGLKRGTTRVTRSARAGRVTPGSARIGSITVDPRALNLKAAQTPRGHYCHHGGCRK